MTTRLKGTGLGLAIVAKIVEEHFGQIEFGDGPDGGSVVRFDLRCRGAGAGSAATAQSPLRKPRSVKDMALDILIVDDEQDIRDWSRACSRTKVSRPAPRRTAARPCRRSRTGGRRWLLLDVWLQGSKLDGLQLLEEFKRRDPTLPVLMISGHGNLDTAVSAIRQGAVDFIEKPFEAGQLVHLVSRATETDRLRRENEALRQQVGNEMELTGTSAAINNVRATLKRVAATGSRVLISGPAGVGKEVAARLLHNWSPRAKGPFIVVTAARMTPERVEEELFGAEEGSEVARPGLLEQAHGGTLFLDEIADMPLSTQGKILRVLTDQSFTRVGGQRTVRVDMRVVSSTSRILSEEIAAGRFREDLYYRLNVVPVHLPALAERREDMPSLVRHFAARYAADQRVATPEISDDAMAALQAYDWPGNVRQLRNVIERTMILAPGERIGRIDIDMLPPEILNEQAQLTRARRSRRSWARRSGRRARRSSANI